MGDKKKLSGTKKTYRGQKLILIKHKQFLYEMTDEYPDERYCKNFLFSIYFRADGSFILDRCFSLQQRVGRRVAAQSTVYGLVMGSNG